MRLESWKNFPQKLVYFAAAGLLLLVLILFGSSDNQANKKSVPVKVQSNQAQNADEVVSKPTQSIVTSGVDSNSPESSNSTKVHVFINANTTNGETTGSTNIEVTTNGETQTFSNDLDETSDGCDFNISVGNGEFDFDCDFDQDSRNETEFEQDVKIKNKQN